MFLEYFPSLQRRSALITLFSFFEHELDKLCRSIRDQEHLALRLSDLSGNGITRSTTYLSKVAGIDASLSSPEWSEIKNIQSIRNLIVHADGKLPDATNPSRKNIERYIDDSPFLGGKVEVELHAGYLAHTLSTFNEYFGNIDVGIQTKFGEFQGQGI